MHDNGMTKPVLTLHVQILSIVAFRFGKELPRDPELSCDGLLRLSLGRLLWATERERNVYVYEVHARSPWNQDVLFVSEPQRHRCAPWKVQPFASTTHTVSAWLKPAFFLCQRKFVVIECRLRIHVDPWSLASRSHPDQTGIIGS